MSKTTPTTKEQKEAQRAYNKLHPTTHTTFRVPKEILKRIDQDIKENGYPNRTTWYLKAFGYYLGDC